MTALIHAPDLACPIARPQSTDPTPDPHAGLIDALARSLAARNPAAAAELGERLRYHAARERLRRRVSGGIGIILSVDLVAGQIQMRVT